MSSIRALLLLLPILAGSSLSASAEIVYDTYPSGTHDPDILVGQSSGNDVQYAYPFDVPVGGADPQLQTITLRLRKIPDMGAEFVLNLRMDAAGEPGAVLESWNVTQAIPNEMDVTLDSVVLPILSRGATYWLNLKVAAGTGAGTWAAANDLTQNFLFATTGDLDPTWQAPPMLFPVGLVQVVVPEPGRALLALTGAAVLLGTARRPRRGGLRARP